MAKSVKIFKLYQQKNERIQIINNFNFKNENYLLKVCNFFIFLFINKFLKKIIFIKKINKNTKNFFVYNLKINFNNFFKCF